MPNWLRFLLGLIVFVAPTVGSLTTWRQARANAQMARDARWAAISTKMVVDDLLNQIATANTRLALLQQALEEKGKL